MASKQIFTTHYQRILSQWPRDLLRPEVSFQTALQRRIDTKLQPTTTTAAAASDPHNIVANGAQATVPAAVPPFDEKAESEQINVLYSLLEDRYRKKYPLPDRIAQPASNPQYYINLVRELEEAPRRSRWGAMLNRWKGFLRFS